MNLFARRPRLLDRNAFYILDFDRCLGRTDSFQGLLEKVLDHWSVVDVAMVRHAHAEVRKTGGSFDTTHFIRKALKSHHLNGDEIWQKIQDEFFATALQHDLFEPHAKELLQTLDAQGLNYGILTFGGDQWQTVKLQAAGLSGVPHMIVSNKQKGQLIASWQQPDGSFIIPPPLGGSKIQRTQRLVFVDDKPISFAGIPKEVRGICVHPNASKEEIARLPKNVVVVKNMREVLRAMPIDKA